MGKEERTEGGRVGEKNRVSEGGRVNVEREVMFSLDYCSVLPTML